MNREPPRFPLDRAPIRRLAVLLVGGFLAIGPLAIAAATGPGADASPSPVPAR